MYMGSVEYESDEGFLQGHEPRVRRSSCLYIIKLFEETTATFLSICPGTWQFGEAGDGMLRTNPQKSTVAKTLIVLVVTAITQQSSLHYRAIFPLVLGASNTCAELGFGFLNVWFCKHAPAHIEQTSCCRLLTGLSRGPCVYWNTSPLHICCMQFAVCKAT